MNRPEIVCLCGSTRFREAFELANFNETMAGNIVLSVGCFKLPDGRMPFSEHQKKALDELHFRKIELADRVLFLNVGGYIGESTARELAYSSFLGKLYCFLEEQAGDEFVSAKAHELARHYPEFARIERPPARTIGERPPARTIGERYQRAFPLESRRPAPVVELSALESPWRDGQRLEWLFNAPTKVDSFEVENPSGYLRSITVGPEEQFLSEPLPLITITQKNAAGRFTMGPLPLPTVEVGAYLRITTSGFEGRMRPIGRQVRREGVLK